MVKNLAIYSQKGIKIRKNEVHKVVKHLQNELNFTVDAIQINFISADQIQEINKKYLNHDYSTDIITFNYSGDLVNLDGEIFISTEDALENAGKFNVDFNQELLRLITHGILHMIGYDDEEPEAKKKMKSLENRFVKELTRVDENYRVI